MVPVPPPQGYLHPGPVLLYHHGVLPIRTAVRDPPGRTRAARQSRPRLGQADRQWHELPPHTQDHTPRSQVPQVGSHLCISVKSFKHEDGKEIKISNHPSTSKCMHLSKMLVL